MSLQFLKGSLISEALPLTFALNGFLWMCAACSKHGLQMFYKQFALGLSNFWADCVFCNSDAETQGLLSAE